MIGNLETWQELRKNMLSNYDECRIMNSRRGPYRLFKPFIIRDKPGILPMVSDGTIRIIDEETHLIWSGRDQTPVIKHMLYEDDEALYQEYKSLNLKRLNDYRPGSRNTIIINKACCLCLWQRLEDLIVYSRSMDIQRAGLTDPAIVSLIAKKLQVDKWTLVIYHPHVYINRSEIARRKI